MTKGGKRQGAGRPALEHTKKNRSIKFTDGEWETVKEKAKEENLTTSDYVRKQTLDAK